MSLVRYSDLELEEFRDIINNKLQKARAELNYLQESLYSANSDNAVESMAGQKLMEEAADVQEREQMSQLAERQQKFINNLEEALMRIQNKTYGICKVTGQLISKERLRAVPHTTMSIEAKNRQ
ncbi:MAG: TraR/DksA family transcriptional regulator [Bacteroidetes bacterium]|jgi:RNA polymerase-binding protein DksA|nr:TraR/DksA family transcriptional regulator [Bacteroidota bacterium]